MKLNLANVARLPAPVRVGTFVVGLLVVWIPLAGPIYWFWGASNPVSAIAMVLLYGEFVFLLQFWGRQVHQQPQPFMHYGLSGGLDLVVGLAVGVLSLFSLFGLEARLGWLVWQTPVELAKVVLAGLAVALGVGLAEELLFRGWLLDELDRDYRPEVSLWACSGLFALLHFIKPLAVIQQSWPQFLGLLLLGLTLVWAKRCRRGRLGLAVGLHGGLVWGYYIVDVADLVNYSGQVPAWVTGINHHPLAGVMGLLFLGCIATSVRALTSLRPVSN